MPFRLNKHSPQARGLVGWWPLGTRDFGRDFSGHDLHLTPFNSPKMETDARRGLVTSFDNADEDRLEYADWSAITTGPFTMSAWVKFDELPSAGGDYPYIFTICKKSVNDQYIDLIAWSGDDKFRWKYGTRSIKTTTIITQTGVWYFICGVSHAVDDNAIFLNGVRENSDVVATTYPTGIDTLTISGRYQSSALDHWMEGRISDVRLYNRGSTDAKVYQLYAPQTRWDLYEPIPRVFPVVVPGAPAAGRTTHNTDPYGLGMAVGVSRTFKVHG